MLVKEVRVLSSRVTRTSDFEMFPHRVADFRSHTQLTILWELGGDSAIN